MSKIGAIFRQFTGHLLPIGKSLGVHQTHLKNSPYSVVSCPQSPILNTTHTPKFCFLAVFLECGFWGLTISPTFPLNALRTLYKAFLMGFVVWSIRCNFYGQGMELRGVSEFRPFCRMSRYGSNARRTFCWYQIFCSTKRN